MTERHRGVGVPGSGYDATLHREIRWYSPVRERIHCAWDPGVVDTEAARR